MTCRWWKLESKVNMAKVSEKQYLYDGGQSQLREANAASLCVETLQNEVIQLLH